MLLFDNWRKRRRERGTPLHVASARLDYLLRGELDALTRAHKALGAVWVAAATHLGMQSASSKAAFWDAYDRSVFYCGRIGDPGVRAISLEATYRCGDALSPLVVEPGVILDVRDDMVTAYDAAHEAMLGHQDALLDRGGRRWLLSGLGQDAAGDEEIEALRTVLISLPRLEREMTRYLGDWEILCVRSAKVIALRETVAQLERAGGVLRPGSARDAVRDCLADVRLVQVAVTDDAAKRDLAHHGFVRAVVDARDAAEAQLDILEGRR